ncbi:AAA family ATPase [Aeromonas sp. Prich7-2]|uniref:McrB family protein n=1 Tax=Aeromonas sp. Prich7-2 TaxID=2823361 RepID=UPI001B32DE15|nr:AAA family ATPase [Aeromonas sp. Prich7-2]MBP4058347.1 AAA family ATPase [Aeromonas sp. Prich7-2]
MTDILYESSELLGLSDSELLERLDRSWGIASDGFKVWGEFSRTANGTWGYLKNPRSIKNNQLLSYPLSGANGTCEFWIHPQDASKFEGTSIFIKCRLEFAPIAERKKHKIPFEMKVVRGSCRELTKLPEVVTNDIFTNQSNESFITKSLYNFYHKQTSIKIEKEFEAKRNEYEHILSLKIQETQEIESKIDSAAQLIGSLVNKQQKLQESNSLLDSDITSKKKQLKLIIDNFRKVEVEMNAKIARLRSYISDKASFLKTFEFLDEDDLEGFLLEPKSQSDKIDGVSFINDLAGDYEKAVSYIQAHLVENDILYPRHIIENYITLLRTKDLIILAGDSGSGKTNLIKSFAKAVGGKSIVVPVKPNWTSSEDLLGYYNPLEKKYLSTPFLEALLEAHKNPETPYFICLDEMNLARVEYYFADFLSLLESRDETPEIPLYAADESAHVLSELKAVVDIIQAGKEKYNQDGVINFIELLKDENLNNYLRQAFGFSDKDSLIKYHSEIRRMLSAVMSMPSSITMPANVHIIGAINIDETTHYLSPKILDRAHIMRFESPLLSDWDEILREVETYNFTDVSKPLLFEVEALGIRQDYPRFDRENAFCKLFIDLNKEFLHKLGVEFGMRTIRQGLNYLYLFEDVNDDDMQAINNFLLHKVLPKLTFDGNKMVDQQTKLQLIDKVFSERIKQIIPTHENIPKIFSAVSAIENVVSNAKTHDGIVNFWN